jgi:hypothetical protein
MLARTSLRGAPLGPSSGKGFLPTWKVKKKNKKKNNHFGDEDKDLN